MLKEATYQEKFNLLRDWMPHIVSVVKRDLKNEHLKNDRAFAKEHFGNKPLGQITEDDLAPVYLQKIVEGEGDESLGEFVANRWMLKNTDVYDFFESSLRAINPNFDQIEELTDEASDQIIGGAAEQFGAQNTYLFSVLNSVVFPKAKLDALASQASSEAAVALQEEKVAGDERTVEAMERRLEREIKRLEDRHEKKLAGMQKKYVKDTETLKKQIANLQRKLT